MFEVYHKLNGRAGKVKEFNSLFLANAYARHLANVALTTGNPRDYGTRVVCGLAHVWVDAKEWYVVRGETCKQ